VLTVAALAAVAVALLAAHDEQPARKLATFPANRVEFARSDWLQTPEAKVARAFAGAGCAVSSDFGDLDGDGAIDRVVAYSPAPSCEGGDRIAIRLATGRVIRHRIAGDIGHKLGKSCPMGCTVFAVSDLNSDGRAEVILQLWHGATQAQLGVYRLGPNGLVRLRLVQSGRSEPAGFSYYGSVCCGSHVVCRGRDRVVDVGYGLDDGFVSWYIVSETVYRFDGRLFLAVASRARDGAGLSALRVPGRDCIEPRRPPESGGGARPPGPRRPVTRGRPAA